MIFATSTPVREELFTVLKRYNKDTREYNDVAIEVEKRHGDEINDLYNLMDGVPAVYYTDTTHFYTKSGTERITNQVVSYIEKALGIKGKQLDYEKLFRKENNVTGL